MNNLPELMSVKELREYLGCSNQKAYELCRKEKFAFRIGKTYRIRKADFVNWVNNQKVEV